MSLRKQPENGQAPAAEGVTDPGAPMTAGQAARLKALAGRAADPDAYAEMLTQAEAQERIDALEALLDREAHGGVERLPRT